MGCRTPWAALAAWVKKPVSRRKTKRLLVVGLSFVVIGLLFCGAGLFGHFYLEDRLKAGLLEAATLDSPDAADYKPWINDKGDPRTVRVYVYQILNENDVLYHGAQPQVEEVGPFVYDQFEKKFDISWHSNNELIKYRSYSYWKFRREDSVADEHMIMRTVNVPFAGISHTLHPTETGRFELYFVYDSHPEIERLFHNVSVNQLLFGFTNDVLKFISWASKGTVKPSFQGFAPNMTSPENATTYDWVFTGKNYGPSRPFRNYYKYKDFEIYQVCPDTTPPCPNPNTTTNIWATPDASRVTGTDGSQLLPGIKKGSDAIIWSINALRPLRYVNQLHGPNPTEVDYKGIKLLRFVLDPKEVANSTVNPRNSLFYQNFANGLFNLTHPGLGTPLWGSRPRFQGVGAPVHGSVNYTNEAVEISHESFFDFEPLSGSAMHIVGRSQLSVYVQPLDGMHNTTTGFNNGTWFRNLKPVLMPIMWIEEEVGISDADATKFRDAVYGTQFLSKMSLYVGVPVSALLIVIGFVVLAKWHNSKAARAHHDNREHGHGPGRQQQQQQSHDRSNLLRNSDVPHYGASSAAVPDSDGMDAVGSAPRSAPVPVPGAGLGAGSGDSAGRYSPTPPVSGLAFGPTGLIGKSPGTPGQRPQRSSFDD